MKLALWLITFIVCCLNFAIKDSTLKIMTETLVILSALTHIQHLITIQKRTTKFFATYTGVMDWKTKIVLEHFKDKNIRIFKFLSDEWLFAITTAPMVIPLLITQSYLVCSIYLSIRIVKFIRINQIYNQLKLL